MRSSSLSQPARRAQANPRPLAVLVLGISALAAGFVATQAPAWGVPGDGREFSSDPTVGTLPLHTGGVVDVRGPDQVIYLYGEVEALRAALEQVDVRWEDGEPASAASGVWALPEGRAWVEFHGTFGLHWDDLRVLQGIEIGVGAGFEGGGLLCAVETSYGVTAPSLLEMGRTMPVSLARLADAGLLQQPVTLHGLHHSGERSRVTFVAANGGLTITQTL
jgi:hypothetical protein